MRLGYANLRRAGNGNPTSILAVVAVMALAFVLANAAAAGPNFNPDEGRWLSRAHFLADLADPFGPTWADRYMTRGQPPLGSYAMGIGLLAQGRDLETNPPWDFSLPWEENIAVGHKPVPEDLAAGRRTSAALVSLTALVLMFVARVFVTMPWALVAGTLYAIHPFTVYIGSIATSDGLFGLLVALAALAAAALSRRPGWLRAAILGVLLGLGGATKLSPLAVAAGIAAGGVVALVVASVVTLHKHSVSAFAIWRQESSRQAGAFARWGLVVGILAMVTFVVAYPYLWPDPIARTGKLFAFRAEEMAAQASDWPVMAVPSRVEALRRVGVNFTERYSLSASVVSGIGGRSAPAPVRMAELFLPLTGILVMAGMAMRAGPYSPQALVLIVLGGQVLVTVLGMRSEFDRYHVPMALLGAVAAAAALQRLAAVACRLPFPERGRDRVGDDQKRLASARQSFAGGEHRVSTDRQVRPPHAGDRRGLGARIRPG